MTALLKGRPGRVQIITRAKLPMAAGVKAWEGGLACILTTTGASRGFVKPGVAATGLLAIGRFAETVDNTSGANGAKSVEVKFHRTIEVIWWTNDSGTPVVAADRGSPCYILDDNVVTGDAVGHSPAGRVYDVSGAFVLVETGAKVVSDDAADSDVLDAGGYFTSTDLEGVTQELGAAMTHKLAVTVGHADLTTAGASQVLNLGAALPANARILGKPNVKLTPFSGGTVSALTVDIGSSGDPDALADGADLFTAAVDGLASSVPAGIAPNKHYATSTQLTGTFVATGGDVVDVTAGSVTIEFLYTILA